MPLVLDGTTGFSGGGGVATSTALGSSALFTNSTGTNLVAIGYQAGYSTTAGPNVFVGSQAGYTNSTGTNNIGIGYQAGYSNTTATNNVAVGYQANYSNQTISNTTAIGYQAGYTNTGDNELVAVGYRALYLATTGTNNTALGHNTLAANTTGSHNLAVGSAALNVNTTGSYNTAIGRVALVANTTGSNNTAVGYQALNANTTAGNSVAVGYQALYTNTGTQNVAIGSQALYSNTSAVNSVAIGYQAGQYNTASGNIFIGQGAGTTRATTGEFNILIGATAQNSALAGNYEIVIGTNNPTGKGSSTGFINPNGGGMYQGNNSANWSTTSDRRLKKNIVDNTDGLNKITAVRVRNFEYRLPEEVTELEPESSVPNTGVQLGVIAQELQVVLPDCVKTETTGVMSVNPDNLVWYLVNAIKELKTLVDAQSALITGQAAEIVALKAKVGL